MKKFLEPIVHIFIWLIGYIFIINFIKTIGVFKSSDSSLIIAVSYGTLLNIILFYTSSLVIVPAYANNKKAWLFIVKIFSLLIITSFLETIIDYSFYTSLYSSVKESFSSQLITNFVISCIFISVALTYGFIRQWIQNEKKKKILIEEKLKAELSFLKAQVNPHFLFNVLNMAYSSASLNGDIKTADIIEKLSGLMRYMIYEGNLEKTEMSQEIQFINDYIHLQKMRISDDIPAEIIFNIKGDYSGLKIAPLILIPFIENAFKYGLKLNQPSIISIELNVENAKLFFRIDNTIYENMSIDKKSSGIGIENVKKRLNLIYHENYKLEIKKENNHFIVQLNLNHL